MFLTFCQGLGQSLAYFSIDQGAVCGETGEAEIEKKGEPNSYRGVTLGEICARVGLNHHSPQNSTRVTDINLRHISPAALIWPILILP